MIERIINCLQNDYDVFIVVGIIVLSILVMLFYHKYEEPRNDDDKDKTRMNLVGRLQSSYFYGAFLSIIIICLFYLYYRIAGEIPNLFSSN